MTPFDAPRSRAFATVVTRNYLASARTLAASIKQYHDDPVYVVCVDDPDGFFDPASEPFTVLLARDLLPEQDRALLFYYTPFEACNAIRAYLHQYLHRHTTHDRWVYLDSDILVTASLDPVLTAMDSPCTGVLSPHSVAPCATTLMEPVETSLQRYGIYNGGCLGLRRSPETEAFISWFVERLRTLCFFKERDVYVDQLWLNFVPLFFPTFRACMQRGLNVAYWNLHERILRQDKGRFTADGDPLMFFHFSLWKPELPEQITFGRTVAPETDQSILATLAATYRDALIASGYHACRDWPYGFATFRDGSPITRPMRRHYYELFVRGAAPPGDPFDHPEWFRHIARRVEWKQFVPRAVRDALRRSLQ